MKTNNSQTALVVVLIVIPLVVIGYFAMTKKDPKIETGPLPFTGTLDDKALSDYVKLPDGKDRQFYPIAQPDSSESRLRDIFSGKAR